MLIHSLSFLHMWSLTLHRTCSGMCQPRLCFPTGMSIGFPYKIFILFFFLRESNCFAKSPVLSLSAANESLFTLLFLYGFVLTNMQIHCLWLQKLMTQIGSFAWRPLGSCYWVPVRRGCKQWHFILGMLSSLPETDAEAIRESPVFETNSQALQLLGFWKLL